VFLKNIIIIIIIKEKHNCYLQVVRKTSKEQRKDPKGTLPHIYSSPPLLTMHPSIKPIVFHFISSIQVKIVFSIESSQPLPSSLNPHTLLLPLSIHYSILTVPTSNMIKKF